MLSPLTLAVALTLLSPFAAQRTEPGSPAVPVQSERPSPRSGGFVVGEPLPDFELPTIDGKSSVRLSSLRGKRLLLIQFASW